MTHGTIKERQDRCYPVASVRRKATPGRDDREATAVDPFDRTSVYAFSSMTAVTGLAYAVSGYFTLVFSGAHQAGNVIALVVLGFLSALLVRVAVYVLTRAISGIGP